MNKKVFYGILFAILILFNCFNVFMLLPLHARNTEGVEPLSEAVTVNYSDSTQTVSGKAILVCNSIESVYQCFDYNGAFLWGVKMPNTREVDSTAYSFDSENVYIWSESFGSVYVFDESGFVRDEKNHDIGNADVFYKLYPVGNDNAFALLKSDFNIGGKLEISDSEGNMLTSIRLDAPFNYYTKGLAALLIVASSVCCLLLKRKISE